MATYSAGVALAFTYEVADGTTGSYTPGGDNRAVFGTIVCGNFGGLPTITELRYGGSGGTDIPRVGSDLTCFGGNGAHGIFTVAPGPTGSTTLFGDWAATPLQSAIAALHYSGVDQTTPFSGHVDATPTLVGGVTTTVASVTVTGCTAGQVIVAAVGALSDNVSLSAFTAVSGTTIRVSDVTGTFCGVAMLEKVATGSSETLSVNVNCSSSGGLYWTVRGARVNDAAGGGGDVTVAITGGAATAAAGSVGVSHSKAVSGDASTAAAGAVLSTRSIGVTGAASTGAPGSVSGSRTVAVSAPASTAAVGSLASGRTLFVTSPALTASAGTVTATTGVAIALTGVSATCSAGSLGSSRVVPVAGDVATASPGQVVGGITKAISGEQSAAGIGSVSPELAVLLSGAGMAGSAGVITTTGGEQIVVILAAPPSGRRGQETSRAPRQQAQGRTHRAQTRTR